MISLSRHLPNVLQHQNLTGPRPILNLRNCGGYLDSYPTYDRRRSSLLSVAGAVFGDGLQDKTLPEITGYREWTRLTEKPIFVENAFAAGGG
jgi:hypothetical protein